MVMGHSLTHMIATTHYLLNQPPPHHSSKVAYPNSWNSPLTTPFRTVACAMVTPPRQARAPQVLLRSDHRCLRSHQPTHCRPSLPSSCDSEGLDSGPSTLFASPSCIHPPPAGCSDSHPDSVISTPKSAEVDSTAPSL